MKIDILTLFPDMFTPLKERIIGRAVDSNKIQINIYDIRDYAKNKHKRCDDYQDSVPPDIPRHEARQ
jgi:tRNA (guanine37-N1)-methyltransferase